MPTAIKEIVGIIVDVFLGSRCPLCRDRYYHLELHRYIDHADVEPHPEPSRFTVEGPESRP